MRAYRREPPSYFGNKALLAYHVPFPKISHSSYLCLRMHFHVASTLHTPEVQIDLTRGNILLRGACFPENATEFFAPIIEFLRENIQKNHVPSLELHLELTYINSTARKSLWQLVKLLLDMGTSLQIVLYRGTEDEELEDYEELVRVWERESRLRIEAREGYYELK